ncbi:hypothetical protein [Campylobacter sp. RM9328]|uniref:hypothetical protein n=1 Tax=Campylobacter sp. RM9328 TaxID=1705720 RepID=UPI0014736077|nr:hypothetical protein [Campylobacter sp. RM9328]
MNTYPNFPKPAVGSSRSIINPTLRSQSEAGYTTSRKKYTRAKREYSLDYPLLTMEQLAILESFFNENQGRSFKFTHPLENVERICIFAMDKFSISDNFSNHCSVKIDLVEV